MRTLNKIEYELEEEIKLPVKLPGEVRLHEVKIIFWPNYKPRGRAANA